MTNGSLPTGLSALMLAIMMAGEVFMMWRTYVSISSGSIWLRGQNVKRSEEPFWFWIYVVTYSVIAIVLFYGMYSAVYN